MSKYPIFQFFFFNLCFTAVKGTKLNNCGVLQQIHRFPLQKFHKINVLRQNDVISENNGKVLTSANKAK